MIDVFTRECSAVEVDHRLREGNVHWFETVAEARQPIESWRIDQQHDVAELMMAAGTRSQWTDLAAISNHLRRAASSFVWCRLPGLVPVGDA